jgi:hypothetical protein
MGLLQKAPEVVTHYRVKFTPDGYGGETPLPDPDTPPTTFRAFVVATGYSGAGWAANIRFQDQGWADIARVRIVFDPDQPGADGMQRWSRLHFRERKWTVQEEPRRIQGTRPRQRLSSAICELLDDEHGGTP